MTCDYGLTPDRCPASPWCGHSDPVPPDPAQLDIFDVLEDE